MRTWPATLYRVELHIARHRVLGKDWEIAVSGDLTARIQGPRPTPAEPPTIRSIWTLKGITS